MSSDDSLDDDSLDEEDSVGDSGSGGSGCISEDEDDSMVELDDSEGDSDELAELASLMGSVPLLSDELSELSPFDSPCSSTQFSYMVVTVS